MKAKPVGLYVHIPFCLSKCNYCDFCSFSNINEQERTKYISTLISEIRSYKMEEKSVVDTVFFGGGTPSLLSITEFNLICDAIADSFDISGVKEFTLEANPKTVTREKLRAFNSRGVNRISLGLQSIHKNELKILGRIHSFDDFLEAYDLVLSSGISNVNIDVMYGIPEQTWESFRKTLDAVVELNPTHISAYGLILEEKTKFFDMRDSLNFPGEDAECDMYGLACRHLAANGYKHYEISNYARPGYESHHNLKYWRCEEYIGVGVAAHSYLDGKRYGNTQNFSEYLSKNSRQYIFEDVLSSSDKESEYIMLGLRLCDGISLSEYEKKFGKSFILDRKKKISRYIDAGYMVRYSDRVALSEDGFYVSNTILGDLI